MGEKDIWEKKLLTYADVFADIVNVLLFDGTRVIAADALADALPRSVYQGGGKTHEQERDVAKFWQQSQLRLALLGLENQTDVDADIPLRVISYDGAAYRQELNNDKKDQEKKQRYPVLTLVLYFGFETHWVGPRRLRECFDKVPMALEPYINDYPIHIVEVAWLPDETIAKFKSDFRLVADLLSQLRKYRRFTLPPDDLYHAEELLYLLNAVIGDERFKEAAVAAAQIPKGAKKTMRLAFLDELEAKSEAKGKAEERDLMFRIHDMLSKHLPYQDIARETQTSVEDVRQIAERFGIAY